MLHHDFFYQDYAGFPSMNPGKSSGGGRYNGPRK